jgi:transcriptional regulator with XRE-family HTH domain
MNLVELAQRIKSKRLQRKLTLSEVASHTGLTRSWLSKVENVRVTPSLQSLGKITEALGVKLSELVDGLDEKPKITIVRHDERTVVKRDRPTSKIVYESLAHKRPNRVMDPFLLTVPAGVARKQALPHEGEEFLVVLEGPVELEYEQQTFRLGRGDAAYFDASVNHRLINHGKKPATVICVFHEGGAA